MITLDYDPFEYQTKIHASDKRFHLIVGGRRVGKSKMALMELIKHCIETPKAMAWWVAPTYSMAREIGWAEFKEYEDDLTPAIATSHETLLRVRFTNGSSMYFKGADNERSLRGRGLTYLIMDEAAFIDPRVWTQALYPALTDRRGKAILASTPNGRNWFYDLISSADDQNWVTHHWPTQMNPLISLEEIEQSKQMVSDQDFRQEFLAEFVTKEGMVYDDFSDDNIIDPVPIDHSWKIYLGVDFGFANPSAIGFFAVQPDNESVLLFDEIYLARRTIHELEEEIHKVLANHGLDPRHVEAIYTDPAGNAEELSSGISPVDYLRNAGWYVQNKASEIAPGLALVRSFIQAADGQRRFFVTSDCKEAIRSLYGYTYERASQKNETLKEEARKDGIHDHFCDAIRYFFVNKYKQNKWIADVPEQYVYGIDTERVRTTMKRCVDCNRNFSSRTAKNQPPFKCKECANV